MNGILFQPFRLHDLTLRNRIVLAPMTRGRAGTARLPNELMAEYYAQRSSAGLLITEATTISEEANGWNESPGIYTDEMTEGWKHTTSAVHEKGGVIFVQLWHTGRASHSSFHGGKPAVAPSAIKINEPEIHTPIGKQPHEVPRALETSEISRIVDDYRQAAAASETSGLRRRGASRRQWVFDRRVSAIENQSPHRRVRRQRRESLPLFEGSDRSGHVRLARPSGRRASLAQRSVQRHGVAGLSGAVHLRRRSTRSIRLGVSAPRRRAGVRFPRAGRADDAGRIPQSVPRPTHGQLRLHPGNGGAARLPRATPT